MSRCRFLWCVLLFSIFSLPILGLSCGGGNRSDDDDDTADDDIIDDDADDDTDDDDISSPIGIKAMTFNLRNGLALDSGNSWPFRKDILCNLVALESPDVMGTQEGWKFQLDYIKNNVPGYKWVGISRQGNQFDEFCAIFYKTDRFELIDTDTFWLSDTPDVVGSKFSDKQLFPRIVTWARFETVEDGRQFFVFNTHFDTYDGDEVPQKSAALLASKIDEIAGNAPVIVTGDFNEYVNSDAHKILTGEMEYGGVSGSLIDPWIALGLPEEGTAHNFNGISDDPSRIDWVLCTEHFAPIAGEVSHYEEGGRYPSDHFPVIVEFEFPDL